MDRHGDGGPEVYLKKSEVAARLRVAPGTVDRWLAGVVVNRFTVQLGCVRAGRVVRIRESDLDAFLEATACAFRGVKMPPSETAAERRRKREQAEVLAELGG